MVRIEIVSGEGTGEGHRNYHSGHKTARAVRRALGRARCGGDRWAFAIVDGERVEDGELDRVIAQAAGR